VICMVGDVARGTKKLVRRSRTTNKSQVLSSPYAVELLLLATGRIVWLAVPYSQRFADAL